MYINKNELLKKIGLNAATKDHSSGSAEGSGSSFSPVLGIIAVFALIILLACAEAFAWYSNYRTPSQGSLGISSDNISFELKGKALFSAPFGRLLEQRGDFLASESGGGEITTSYDRSGLVIALQISDSDNGDLNLLAPGTSGTASFKIVRLNDETSSVIFKPEIIGIHEEQEEGHDPEYSLVTSAAALDYTAGHILFFREKSADNVYSQRIDGSFEVGLTGDETEVTLYWIWPNTFADMLGKSGKTSRIASSELPALISDMGENPQHYFSLGDMSGIDESFISNAENASAGGSAEQNEAYLSLSAGYNNADQIIGTELQYIVVEISTLNGQTE